MLRTLLVFTCALLVLFVVTEANAKPCATGKHFPAVVLHVR